MRKDRTTEKKKAVFCSIAFQHTYLYHLSYRSAVGCKVGDMYPADMAERRIL